MTTYPMSSNLKWGDYVTPKRLRDAPTHRWLTFPHSFTDGLIHELISKWELTNKDIILDPFAGAGTTLLAAQMVGIKSQGYDLSPFAVFASKVKTKSYSHGKLSENWPIIKNNICRLPQNKLRKKYPDLIHKALSPQILLAFENAKHLIFNLSYSTDARDFFLLALLAIIPTMSRAQASGGWLKWIEKEPSFKDFISALELQVQLMLNDVASYEHKIKPEASIEIADARTLPNSTPKYSAVITSPPYPNRHDYTRVFGVELMFGFLDWDQTRSLRYQSIHSHPEARPKRPATPGYQQPSNLQKALQKIRQIDPKSRGPRRVATMLDGYFLDLFCCFREIKRVTLDKARIAVVLGNAQYYGEPILVDELAAEIGEYAGLKCSEIITARNRGNSAQQMKKYGRSPSRESVIIFQNKS